MSLLSSVAPGCPLVAAGLLFRSAGNRNKAGLSKVNFLASSSRMSGFLLRALLCSKPCFLVALDGFFRWHRSATWSVLLLRATAIHRSHDQVEETNQVCFKFEVFFFIGEQLLHFPSPQLPLKEEFPLL